MERILIPPADPAFHLAAEEVFLTRPESGDVLLLWANPPSVIVGKFQNPYAEVSLTACRREGIPVLRRNSGGGCVYHDPGNLNYTVLTRRGEDFPDYARFLSPVVRGLCSLGVPAQITDTSAMTVEGKKFSGSAQSNVRAGGEDRLLHHGTLLFDADLDALNRITGHAREAVKSKATRSNPSPVTNLAPLLREAGHEMSRETFADWIASLFEPSSVREMTEEERAAAETLAREKYRTWEWNFGRTGAFTMDLPGLRIESRNGKITSAETEYCDPAALEGLPLTPEAVERISPAMAALIFD